MQEKTNVFFAVCSAVLKLEVEKGHLQWTISDVSRHSNITRSLIYYYFGSEKETVLMEAYKFIVEVFFGRPNGDRDSIPVRIKEVLRDLKRMPYLFVLYYLQKNEPTEIGELIRKAEAQLMKDLKKAYPQLTEQEILQAYLRELGAIAFQLDEARVDDTFKDYAK